MTPTVYFATHDPVWMKFWKDLKHYHARPVGELKKVGETEKEVLYRLEKPEAIWCYKI